MLKETGVEIMQSAYKNVVIFCFISWESMFMN